MNNPTEPQSETPRTNAAKFECSPSPYEGFTAVPSALSVILEEEGNALRAQVVTLTEQLESLSDHGSAAERMDFLKAQNEEIAALRREAEQLREDKARFLMVLRYLHSTAAHHAKSPHLTSVVDFQYFENAIDVAGKSLEGCVPAMDPLVAEVLRDLNDNDSLVCLNRNSEFSDCDCSGCRARKLLEKSK